MTISIEQPAALADVGEGEVIVRKSLRFREAASNTGIDLSNGLSLIRLATFLAWREFFLPYRFGFFGPIWTTLQTALWVVVIGFFLGPSLSSKGVHYFAYIAVGYTIYTLFVVYFSEGSQLFIKSRSYILNIPNPFSIYVFKLVIKAGIHLIMASPVIISTIILTDVPVSGSSLLFIPGLVLATVFGFGIGLTLGAITVFYRDVAFFVQALMRLLMFMTPIFWVLDGDGLRANITAFNPIQVYLNVIREPILGGVPPIEHWLVAGMLALAALFLGVSLFAVYRNRLAVWL